MLFAPFISEVITGKIISTSKAYVRGQSPSARLWVNLTDGNSQHRFLPRYLHYTCLVTSKFNLVSSKTLEHAWVSELTNSDPVEQKYFWVLTDDERPLTSQEIMNTVTHGQLTLSAHNRMNRS